MLHFLVFVCRARFTTGSALESSHASPKASAAQWRHRRDTLLLPRQQQPDARPLLRNPRFECTVSVL
jgi:hypothetical protein